MEPNSKMLSLLIPSYYSGSRLQSTYSKVAKELTEEKIPFEIIIIDDGSTDDSYAIACDIEKKDHRVHAYRMSRNFTTHYVRFAAINMCKGQCFTTIPDDMQLPIETIIDMYRIWEQGQKVIVPYRASRNDGKVNDFFSNLYYKIMNSISEVKFPPGGADGFLIDREIIDIFKERISPLNTSTMIEVLRLGFNPSFIPYNRPTVKSKSRWTLKKKLRLALDTVLASSSFPIKFIVFIGLVSVVMSFFLVVSGIIIRVFLGGGILGFSIPGWTTNFVLITFFSGLILFSLGIIAEYIWRIYEEVKNRPGYIIRNKNDRFTYEKKEAKKEENR